jgi:hypothetical protein
MKTLKLLQFGFLAAVMMAGTTFGSYASSKGNNTEDLTKVKVVRLKGSARFTTGTGSWQPLKVGDILTAGTVIQTAEDSRVDMVLGNPKATPAQPRIGLAAGSAGPGGAGGDGTQPPPIDQNFIRMQENTVLSVDKLTATDTGAGIVTDTQLDLRAGRILGTVKKLSPGSLYEVKIPSGVAGVRGTIYALSADGTISVLVGQVVVAIVNSDGQVIRREIKTGQQYDPRTDTVSDISPAGLRELVEGILQASVRPMIRATVFTEDGTKIYISPKAGFSSGL